jgi:hypothetical protein
MKKEYMKPQVEVVRVNMKCQIMAGSVQGVNSNAGLIYNGSGSSTSGRSRDYDDWEEE